MKYIIGLSLLLVSCTQTQVFSNREYNQMRLRGIQQEIHLIRDRGAVDTNQPRVDCDNYLERYIERKQPLTTPTKPSLFKENSALPVPPPIDVDNF